MFDFDAVPDRRNTGSLKWDLFDADILPMWVADMDFQSPPAVVEALQQRAADGIFGYTMPQDSLYDAIISSLDQCYGWQVKREWFVWLPALVPALNLSCRAYVSDGGVVATHTPVYPPFLSAPKLQSRKLFEVPMTQRSDQSWELRQNDLESVPNDAELFLFCNPHNPVGKVYKRDEIERVARFCVENDIVLCSDEIHCDLLLDEPVHHIPTASISEEIAMNTITLMSPSKTYNMPGLGCAFVIIPNPELHRAFKRQTKGLFDGITCIGLAACEAAYRDGGQWLRELLEYLRENRDRVAEFVADELPDVSVSPIEATYLAWLDCRAYDETALKASLRRNKIALSDGRLFGGPGFMRLNFACPRQTLETGLQLLKQSILDCS